MDNTVNARTNSIFTWEVFFLGGSSILTCALIWLLVPRSANLYTISKVAFGLSFAFNHPHFLSSYMLMYGDFRSNIRGNLRYIWAAIVAPVILGAFLIYAFAAGRPDLVGHSLNLMFFLVGWHYVKQIFGCVIVTSARRKLYYSQLERRLLLTNLFSIWAVSFVMGQAGSASFTFYGIVYAGLGFTGALIPYLKGLVAVTFLAVVITQFRKYKISGVKPSVPGMVALGSLYVWYLPVFAHPAFGYFIPMFHSMQYLVFVTSFKKNQLTDQVQTLEEEKRGPTWWREFAGYAITAVLLGALAFEFVPKFLDGQNLLHNSALGTSPFVAAFLLFINIHHYFIDNVIWRASNDQVKKYLFAPAEIFIKSPAGKTESAA